MRSFQLTIDVDSEVFDVRVSVEPSETEDKSSTSQIISNMELAYQFTPDKRNLQKKGANELLNVIRVHNYEDSLEKIDNIFYKYPTLDLNKPDPRTGRTLAHELVVASKCNCYKVKNIMEVLAREYKADLTQKDKMGLSVAELFYNQCDFDPEFTVEECQETYNRRIHFIGELNAELDPVVSKLEIKTEVGAKLKPRKRLEMVDTTEDMLNFIKAHPEYKQIGFVIKMPNIFKPEGVNLHLSPIVYDADSQTFVQLDSLGSLYSIPGLSGFSDFKIYYSPLQRQASDHGCGDDVVLILYFIMTKFPDFIKFCLTHSKQDDELLLPLNDQERLQSKSPALDKQTEKRFNLRGLIERERLCQSMLNKPERIKNVYRLMDWPIELVHFLERYDQVRPFRTHEKLGHPSNKLSLRRLLNNGVIREKLHLEELFNNLFTTDKDNLPLKRYDVGGRNMEERYYAFINIRNSRRQTVRRLFNTKLNQKNFFYANPESEVSSDLQKDDIADRIACFATAQVSRRG